MKDMLLIIDGAAMLTTAYYGTLPSEIKFNKNHEEDYLYYDKILHSKSGYYTNGIFSFMNRLDKILKMQQPSHIAITFDLTRDTFRRKLYPAYKANRKETPEPLKQQRALLPKMLMEMGITCFACNDFEGDDLIGSLTEKFRGQIPVRILANDHDMMQLVKPNVQLWMTMMSQDKADMMYLDYTQGSNSVSLHSFGLPDAVFPFGRESIKWDMGVYPEQITDLKGLSGDSSDNIPGVKGISDKTAAILLSEYGTVENLFDVVEKTDADTLKQEWKNKLGFRVSPVNKLKAPDAKEKALLSKKLATIITDLQFPVTLDTLACNINTEVKNKWYKELDFYSLLDNRNMQYDSFI